MFNFFFFNDTATTEIYTLSLHDALPIYADAPLDAAVGRIAHQVSRDELRVPHASLGIDGRDRKSTRLNSSHLVISYAVFCLKKKNTKYIDPLIAPTLWILRRCHHDASLS